VLAVGNHSANLRGCAWPCPLYAFTALEREIAVPALLSRESCASRQVDVHSHAGSVPNESRVVSGLIQADSEHPAGSTREQVPPIRWLHRHSSPMSVQAGRTPHPRVPRFKTTRPLRVQGVNGYFHVPPTLSVGDCGP
jgi:hypothetical protein